MSEYRPESDSEIVDPHDLAERWNAVSFYAGNRAVLDQLEAQTLALGLQDLGQQHAIPAAMANGIMAMRHRAYDRAEGFFRDAYGEATAGLAISERAHAASWCARALRGRRRPLHAVHMHRTAIDDYYALYANEQLNGVAGVEYEFGEPLFREYRHLAASLSTDTSLYVLGTRGLRQLSGEIKDTTAGRSDVPVAIDALMQISLGLARCRTTAPYVHRWRAQGYENMARQLRGEKLGELSLSGPDVEMGIPVQAVGSWIKQAGVAGLPAMVFGRRDVMYEYDQRW